MTMDTDRRIPGAEIETTVKVVFYSMYGHTHEMAEEVAEGARQVPGTRVELLQVAELVPEETLDESGAKQARAAFDDVPVAEPDDLVGADALLFGTPTRFGNMAAQMRNFLDQTGGLWFEDALVGTVGGVFTSANTQHGGQESTLLTAQVTLQHLGMIVVGVPYTEKRQQTMDEISGGSTYGASTVAGLADSPTDNERGIARFQGRHAATVARHLKLGRALGVRTGGAQATDAAA
jgi:NAD(P)H dehydrogenase (quinone)